MPYEVRWYQESRVVLQRIYGEVDADDLVAVADATAVLLNEGMPPVHIIADLSQLRRCPTSITKVRASLHYLDNPALGWTMLVTGNVLVHFMADIIGQATKLRVSQRRTLDEAAACLDAQDATLITGV